MNTSIPFLDLVTPHVELESELMEVFRTALRSAAFIGGRALQSFEEHFAAFTGAATEMRTGHAKRSAQDVEQRTIGIGVDVGLNAIEVKSNARHR